MALSPELELLCAEIDKIDPAAGKAQRELLEKHESLQKITREQRLRQVDYDKKQDELKEHVEYGKTMRTWAKDNVPKFDTMKTERDEAVKRAEKAEKEVTDKVAAAVADAAAKGANIDPDKLADAVRAKMAGEIVSKTEIATMVNAEAQKLVNGTFETARQNFYKEDVPKMAGLNSALTEAQLRFNAEFPGEFLDAEEYVSHLAAAGDKYVVDGKFDRKKSYDAYVDRKRESKGVEARIQEEARKRADAILAERGVSGGFPGTSGAPGPLQMRFNAKDVKDPLFGAPVELGDGSAAAAAAAELHSEGR